MYSKYQIIALEGNPAQSAWPRFLCQTASCCYYSTLRTEEWMEYLLWQWGDFMESEFFPAPGHKILQFPQSPSHLTDIACIMARVPWCSGFRVILRLCQRPPASFRRDIFIGCFSSSSYFQQARQENLITSLPLNLKEYVVSLKCVTSEQFVIIFIDDWWCMPPSWAVNTDSVNVILLPQCQMLKNARERERKLAKEVFLWR